VGALAGAPLATLKAMMRAREAELPRGEGAEYQIYPDPLKEPYYARRRDVGALLYAALGIARENRPARIAQDGRTFQVFDAPGGRRRFRHLSRLSRVGYAAVLTNCTHTALRPGNAAGE